MTLPRYNSARGHAAPHVLAKATDVFRQGTVRFTGAEAEERLLNYLRLRLGKPVDLWHVCYAVCESENWIKRRPEAMFIRRQMVRLIQEGKIIRYHRQLYKDKIRIHEGYAHPEYSMAHCDVQRSGGV